MFLRLYLIFYYGAPLHANTLLYLFQSDNITTDLRYKLYLIHQVCIQRILVAVATLLLRSLVFVLLSVRSIDVVRYVHTRLIYSSSPHETRIPHEITALYRKTSRDVIQGILVDLLHFIYPGSSNRSPWFI
jgi:hypothetical protein